MSSGQVNARMSRIKVLMKSTEAWPYDYEDPEVQKIQSLLKDLAERIGACPDSNEYLGYERSTYLAYYRTSSGYYWRIPCANYRPYGDIWEDDPDSGVLEIVGYGDVPTDLLYLDFQDDRPPCM
jgi:hypothetical protein